MMKYKTGFLLLVMILQGCSEEPIVLGQVTYSTHGRAQCEASTRQGQAGIHNEEATESGIKYTLRTPSNYDSTRAHPLLVVFPAASHGSRSTERFTKFTQEATSAGMIVVYPGRNRLSPKVIDKLGDIPVSVSKKWCIDEKRIFYTGHSDGGTATHALSFFDSTKDTAAAIAPSAAGMRLVDLQEYACPQPLPVMVMHNHDDDLFPGYGKQAAEWWAACNQCSMETTSIGIGCIEYEACKQGTRTVYCEDAGSHTVWPGRNLQVLDFFLNVKTESHNQP